MNYRSIARNEFLYYVRNTTGLDTINSDSVVGHIHLRPPKPLIDNGIHTYKRISQSIPRSVLSEFESMCLTFYTGHEGYAMINDFLYDNEYKSLWSINTRPDKILDYIRKKYPIGISETANEYSERVKYYYLVNLYTVIQRGPKLNKQFILFRGTKTWYLQQNTDVFYYMNSFASSSYSENSARGFGEAYNHFDNDENDSDNHDQSPKLYMFFVHPSCNYMNITNFSHFDNEKEVLLTPYHRYLYVGDEYRDEFKTRKYVILPCDLEIPDTYETFMPWKEKVNEFSIQRIKHGGKIDIDTSTIVNSHTDIHTTKKFPMRNIPLQPHPRFTDPIHSFPGAAPTPDEMEMIKTLLSPSFIHHNKTQRQRRQRRQRKTSRRLSRRTRKAS